MLRSQDFSKQGLSYPTAWASWEGKATVWPSLRSCYPLLVPGPTALALLSVHSSASSLLVLFLPLALVVLAERPTLRTAFSWLLPMLLAPLTLYALVRFGPQLPVGVEPSFALPAAATLLMLVLAGGPIAVSKSYLYSFPAVTQAQRAKPARLIYVPPALALALILGGSALLADRGFAFAVFLPAVLSLLLIAWPPRLIPRAAKVLALYLQARSSGDAKLSPGVWRATSSLGRRSLAWNTQAALVSVACAALAPALLGDEALERFVGSGLSEAPFLTAEQFTSLALFALLMPSVLMLGCNASALWSLERLKSRLLRDHESHPRILWDCITSRLRNSPLAVQDEDGRIVHERDHLFVGFHHESGAPVLLHRSVLDEHAYICGRSGSGKTSRSLMPLLMQLVRDGEARGEPMPILVLDLKGDLALFHTAREEAERKRQDGSDVQDFCFFTLDSSRPGLRFNPLETFCSRPRHSLELANQLLEAISLDHGDQYGRSFYAGGSREILEAYLREEEARVDFTALYQRVEKDRDGKKFEIGAKLHALAGYEQLRSRAGSKGINMHEVLERGQLAYFFLDASTGAVGAREVVRLALFALLDAAIQRQKEGKPQRQTYVIIDEFQVVATVNIQQVIQQARSRGVSLVLANQSLEDLRVQGTNLLSVVQTNTRYKQFFSVTDAQSMRDLAAQSGEKVVFMPSYGTSTSYSDKGMTTGTSESWSARLEPRLGPNSIVEASKAEGGAIVHLASSHGLSNFGGAFLRIVAPHCLAVEEYRRRASTPLPVVQQPVLPVADIDRRSVYPASTSYSLDRVAEPGPGQEEPALHQVKAERDGRLTSLFDALRAAENTSDETDSRA